MASSAYVKLDPMEAWPRLKIARAIDASDGAMYLGPFPSSGSATLAKEALEESFRIRRCTRRWVAAPGSPRVRSPTWAGARRRATAAPIPSATARWSTSCRRRLAPPGRLLRGSRRGCTRSRRRNVRRGRARARPCTSAGGHPGAHAHRPMADGAGRWWSPPAASASVRGRRAGPPRQRLGAGGPIGAPAPRERADELSVVRSWVRRNRCASSRPTRRRPSRSTGARTCAAARPDPRGRGTGRGPRRGRDRRARAPVPVPTRR